MAKETESAIERDDAWFHRRMANGEAHKYRLEDAERLAEKGSVPLEVAIRYLEERSERYAPKPSADT